MNIAFEALKKKHFPLLLRWLKMPRVKKWWDKDVNWTMELIEEKYSSYTKGFKCITLETQVIEKPMHAFIISYNGVDIGYIQYYNKHDFQSEQDYDISCLPKNLAAFDWYIGELEYVGKGIGSKVLSLFLS